MRQHVFTPGPVPLPPPIVERLAEPAPYHHGQAAQSLFKSVFADLQSAFYCSTPVLALHCSGTGGVESVMLNTLHADSFVIVANNGRFAQRWCDMLASLDIPFAEIPIAWGEPVTEAAITEALRVHPQCTAVWLVHNETSTGTVSDLQSLASTIRQHSNALICVDAVSSLAVHELRMDDWGLDCVVSASQKGLMLPAGLAFVALSGKAIDVIASTRTRSMYFDLRRTLQAYERGRMLWTPPMNVVAALQTSLRLLLDEGMVSVWQRHADVATHLRHALQESGFKLFSASPSNAVTAVRTPESHPRIVDILEQRFGLVVAKGQDHLVHAVFRIGHMGYYTYDDIESVAGACRSILLS